MISEMRAPSRLSYGRIPNLVELKDLIATQVESFHWFKSEGLRELFDEINPITDYTGKNFELKFLDYEFGQPKFSVEECRNRDMTYAAPLRIKTRLTIKETGEIKESEVYMGDFAMMTDEGTFIVNGTERVVVSQLVRSPGVYFTAAEDPNTGRKLFGAKLIPNRGAWLEIETSAKDLLTVKIDRKRKVPVTVLLKALELPQLKGTENDREAQKRALLEMFGDVDNNPEHRYMESTLDKDTTMKTEDALLELYRRVRPGDPPVRRQRPQPAAEPVLQPAPVRPRPCRPLQGRQAAGPRRGGHPRARPPARAPDSREGRLHRLPAQADRAQQRAAREADPRRHRPPRQPPRARGRRAAAEPVPDGAASAWSESSRSA